jgi:hypothetical protein
MNYEEKGEGIWSASAPRATSSAQNASPSDFPMNSPFGELEAIPNEHSLADSLEHLMRLVFEVCHDMEIMKFNIEILNQRISWLVALHASEALKCPASELSTQFAILLHVPIPLPMSDQSSSPND